MYYKLQTTHYDTYTDSNGKIGMQMSFDIKNEYNQTLFSDTINSSHGNNLSSVKDQINAIDPSIMNQIDINKIYKMDVSEMADYLNIPDPSLNASNNLITSNIDINVFFQPDEEDVYDLSNAKKHVIDQNTKTNEKKK